MKYWEIIIIGIVSNVIIQIGLTIRTKIKESYKLTRFKESIKLDNSKIEAIGNYEEKSKNKFFSKKES